MQLNSQLKKNPFNPSLKRMERPTDSIGELETTGEGVGVAVFDSGIFPHPTIDDNLVAAVTFGKTSHGPDTDKKGHGTATAAVIAGTGKGSNGQIKGVAPGAKLINVQVLTEEKGQDIVDGYSSFLGAIDWTIANKDKFNIRVINISGGYSLIPKQDENGQISSFIDPFGTSIKKAIDAGIVVVAAAGNDGPGPGTVLRTPNHNPNVITVGALDTKGTQDDFSDDTVAGFSSRGPTLAGDQKPDLVASGVAIMSALAPNSEAARNNQAKIDNFEKVKNLSDQEVLPYIQSEREAKRLSAESLSEAVPSILPVLPEKFQAFIASREPKVQAMMALSTLEKLTAKGAVDTESEAFKSALQGVRRVLEDKLEPQPTAGFLDNGEAAFLGRDGTSFSAPIVSGVIAHMFEANPNLTPAQVKEILTSTARPVANADPTAVGAGALDARAAVAKARALSENVIAND